MLCLFSLLLLLLPSLAVLQPRILASRRHSFLVAAWWQTAELVGDPATTCRVVFLRTQFGSLLIASVLTQPERYARSVLCGTHWEALKGQRLEANRGASHTSYLNSSLEYLKPL